MIEYTLLNVFILKLKIYCDPDKFYGLSKFGQYDEVKDRAPLEYTHISADTFLQQTIWNNKYVCYKGKTLFFQNWVKSGFKHVCDLFDENGVFRSIDYFLQTIQKRNNILCEYKILKSVFTKLGKHFEFSNAKYVNPKYNYMFLFHDGLKFMKNTKCKLYYNSLLVKKRQLSPYQCILSREFDIQDSYIWCKIYLNKIKYFSDPIIEEFNYKLLHNILNNNYLVSKWKVGFDMNSTFSSSRDTTVQNLDFTRQTTDITHFAVVFHYDVISI